MSFSFPKKPKLVEKKENRARFEIEALYPGYGITIGNSLRRVLLSSLEGAAVTQVKIKGVPHEFSTIPGVLEDVILIIQNLKKMRFKLYSPEPQKAALKVKGEKEVKGSHFDFPSQVELINKNCHIATLTEKSAKLEMEIQIEKGIGYSPRETMKKEKLEIGTILLDAIFTPVKKVSFEVENMRVGERTDFDRLFLDIETDNTQTPEEALGAATEILLKHFSPIKEAFPKEEFKEDKSSFRPSPPKEGLEKEEVEEKPKKIRQPAEKTKKKVKRIRQLAEKKKTPSTKEKKDEKKKKRKKAK